MPFSSSFWSAARRALRAWFFAYCIAREAAEETVGGIPAAARASLRFFSAMSSSEYACRKGGGGVGRWVVGGESEEVGEGGRGARGGGMGEEGGREGMTLLRLSFTVRMGVCGFTREWVGGVVLSVLEIGDGCLLVVPALSVSTVP